MLLNEFQAQARRYRRAAWRRVLAVIGFVVLYTVLALVLAGPLIGPPAPEGRFLLLYSAGLFIVVGWLLGSSRAWNTKWGVRCPLCCRSIGDRWRSIVRSGRCPYCREQVVSESSEGGPL